MVERSPEKAGVGGSTPSLATIIINGLAALLTVGSEFPTCTFSPVPLQFTVSGKIAFNISP